MSCSCTSRRRSPSSATCCSAARSAARDFPRGNHDQLLSSIRERLWPLGDDIQFVPGHGQTSTFGWERKTNPYVADLLFDDD